jgi:CubicO group peptidase (beta-lactamase class C family)
MNKSQFRVLYHEFLFRVVDLEILAPQGDITKLLGQFAALLLFFSLWLTIPVVGIASADPVPEIGLIGAWTAEHFLISTTMLVVGLFAVMSWDSMFPDRRDVLVLSPLPVRAPALFLAKAAAVATGLGITVLALNAFTGIAAPFVFASAPVVPPPKFDAAMAPVDVDHMQAVLDHDLMPAFAPNGALARGNGAGAVVGIVKHGDRRIFAYGTARPDSIYEIGSISKTFTALILARMIAEGRVRLDQPIRELLPTGVVAKPNGAEITLLDLATHHSGLPRMPSNLSFEDMDLALADYHTSDLYTFLARHGVGKPPNAHFVYSNLGFGLLGEALAHRAGTSYAKLLAEEVTGPLGLTDTTITLSSDQRERLIQAYNQRHKPVPAWDIGALTAAGGIRSTAGDMLTYLEAQLHPEKLPPSLNTLRTALVDSHHLRADAEPGSQIALGWMYLPLPRVYWHNGSISGYTSYAFFGPLGDYAGVALFNAVTPAGFCGLLAQHVGARLTGLPAFSLTNQVFAGKGGVPATVRSFAVYWFTVLASGIFLLGLVLSVQGLAQLLPRQLFLRVSSFLQIAFFIMLLTVYFLQPGFSDMETLAENQATLGWLPSYWFFGLFQQLNGPINPALTFLPHRAWIGLGAAIGGAAGAYLLCYLRTLRKVAEQPDILPDSRRFRWLPRFGGSFETALGQFSVRSLLRSRQHRVLWSFYLGSALGLALFFSKAPILREQRPEDLWFQVNAPLLVASILMVCVVVAGTRVVFALPLEPRANWMFQVMPLPAMSRCLPAVRRALYTLALGPLWLALALFFFLVWPWRIAAGHLAILALLGIVVAELWLYGFQKIPFTCSYQPGKSKFNMAFLIAGVLMFLIVQAASLERSALDNPYLYAAVAGTLFLAALLIRHRTTAQASSESAALQFDDPPEPAILSLGLYRDGILPLEPTARGPSAS